MTSDADDALTWEGDEDPAPTHPKLPRGWKAVGAGSEDVEVEGEAPAVPETAEGDVVDLDAETADAEPEPLSTTMLVLLGVIGGIYLLYMIGWVIGGLRLQDAIVADVMYRASLWAAVLTPALWFGCVWVFTRKARSWVRVLGLIAGVLLLVPWPFVMMTGATL